MAAGKLRALAGGATASAASDASPLLESLGNGEINVEQYLEARVEEALEPLLGKVPASQLDWIRAMLTAQLREDPVLATLVEQATQGPGT